MRRNKLLSFFKLILRHRSSFCIIVFFITLFAYSFLLRYAVKNQYIIACALMRDGDYDGAITHFQQIGDYKDSIESLELAQNYVDYNSAKALFDAKQYMEAAQRFEQLGGFQDSVDLAIEARYQYAIELFQDERYNEATIAFQELGDYKDSILYVAKIALALYENQQKTVYDEACRFYAAGKYSLAIENFESLGDYLDSKELAAHIKQERQESLSTTISAGIRYSVAVTKDNKTISTGYNYDGQSDVLEWEDIISVSAKGIYTIGLKSDGTVVTSSKISNFDDSDWTDIIAVSAGERFIIGLKSDGSLVSAGHDMGDGQRKVDDWENIVAIATGWKHTVGLDGDGKIHITGYRAASQLEQISERAEEWENIIAIAAGGGSNSYPGSGHTVGLRADGRVVAVGDNEYGQCDVSGWENIVAIAAGDWHTVGLCKDGTVVSTSPDPRKYPKLYLGACEVDKWKDLKIVAISAGCGTTLGLQEDGSVNAIGFDDFKQSTIADSWSNIKTP